MPRTSPRQWQRKALDLFEANAKRVFQYQELAQLLGEQRGALGAPASLSVQKFVEVLATEGQLRKVEIASAAEKSDQHLPAAGGVIDGQWVGPVTEVELPRVYRPFTRYLWGEASPYEIALSLRTGSYLSHASAVFLHGLTGQIPRTIYVNKEQTPKPPARGGLSQASIASAFARPPRLTNFVFTLEGVRYALLNGKQTGDLEVSEMRTPAGPVVRATKLERTLIDIAVRPSYGGGVFEVMAAFQAARERVSVATLVATLRKLEYIYPYHQALGFYLQRAGVPARRLDRLKALGLQYDFYLANQMPEPRYDSEWRIYYPSGLQGAETA